MTRSIYDEKRSTEPHTYDTNKYLWTTEKLGIRILVSITGLDDRYTRLFWCQLIFVWIFFCSWLLWWLRLGIFDISKFPFTEWIVPVVPKMDLSWKLLRSRICDRKTENRDTYLCAKVEPRSFILWKCSKINLNLYLYKAEFSFCKTNGACSGELLWYSKF